MSPWESHQIWRFGNFVYDVANNILWLEDEVKPIQLEKKTQELLRFLLREAVSDSARTIPRAEVWANVWPELEYEPQPNTIDRRVSQLRKILQNEADSSCPYIISVKKQGLRFALPVAEKKPMAVPVSNIDTITSLAILPMVNKSGDKERDYLCDVVTERLIIRLSKLSHIKVMAASTMFIYKGEEITPRDVGRELNVQAVLTLKLLAQAKSYIVSVELFDVKGGWELWGDDFTIEGTMLTERLEREIAAELVEELHIRLTAKEKKELVKQHSNNLEAHDLYLKGRHLWSKRTSEGLLDGVKHFWLAIDLDPSFALAYAGVAACYNLLSYYSGRRPSETFPVARLAAETALKIDDELAEAHTSLAYTLSRYYWKWSDAEKSYKRAIGLNSSYPTAHQWYAEYLIARGRFDEAIKQVTKAQELSPDSSIINATVGTVFYFARKYDRAIEEYKKTINKDPRCLRAHFRLGRAYMQKGMFDESFKTFERAKELCETMGGTFEVLELANLYAMADEKNKALELIGKFDKIIKQRYISEYNIATVYASLRDTDQAFKWLERACESRDPWIEHLNVDPRLDRIRRYARFKDLRQLVESSSPSASGYSR